VTPAEQSCRAEIEITWRSLEEHFAMLREKCLTADQKTQLRNTCSAARYACWKLDETEPAIEDDVAESTYNALKIINARIEEMLKNVDDIAAFLNLAAEAVRLAEIPSAVKADDGVDQAAS
jgi:hypothetical protein